MAGNDPVDQDAIAAQWEASLDSEDPAEAAQAAAANELSGTMALQWAAMVEDGSRDFGGGKNGGERVLSQEEIDNLLGFSAGEVNLDDNSGIRAIIDSAMVSYERLPMLEIVFDRLVRLMTTSLRNFTSDNVEVSLDRITSVRFGDYMNSIPLPAVLSVFQPYSVSAMPGRMPQARTMGRLPTSAGATMPETRPMRTITMMLEMRMTAADMRISSSWSRAWRENIRVVAVEDARPPKTPSTAAPWRAPMMRRAR